MPFCGFASLLGSSWVECHPSAIRQPKDPALTLVCLSSFLTKDPVCIVQATLTLHCKDIVPSGKRKTASDSQRHVASRILSSTFNNLQPLPTTLIHIHRLSSRLPTFTHFNPLSTTLFWDTFWGTFFCDRLVSYLISLKCLLFKNISHYGSFSAFLAVPGSALVDLVGMDGVEISEWLCVADNVIQVWM